MGRCKDDVKIWYDQKTGQERNDIDQIHTFNKSAFV